MLVSVCNEITIVGFGFALRSSAPIVIVILLLELLKIEKENFGRRVSYFKLLKIYGIICYATMVFSKAPGRMILCENLSAIKFLDEEL